MKRQFILSLLLCLFTSLIYGQTKPKQTPKPVPSELKKLVARTGLPFNLVNDSLAIIPFEGENIANYDVLVQKIGDLYIIYTNLTEVLPGKIDESKFKYLLQKNDHFDIVKIGMNSDDNTVYLRADVYKAGLTSVLLTRIIRQVGNVTNIIAGDLK
jgi:hypothetical protein